MTIFPLNPILDIREAGNGRRGTTSSSSLDSSWKRSTRVRSNDKNVKKIAKSLVKKIENINISEEVMKRVMGQDLSIMSLDTLWHYLFENIWLNKSPKLNLLWVFFFKSIIHLSFIHNMISFTHRESKQVWVRITGISISSGCIQEPPTKSRTRVDKRCAFFSLQYLARSSVAHLLLLFWNYKVPLFKKRRAIREFKIVVHRAALNQKDLLL